MTEVQGLYAAAITPRNSQGEIDFGAAFELIDFLSKAGVNGIAICASTGEFAALNLDERSRLVYLSLKRSRVPVLVGVGSATLDSSLTLAREARDAGAAGLLVPPPHFFPYDQDDLREFYLQFARQMGPGIPLFLSHLPFAGARLETVTLLDLLATGYFAGVEDGGGADLLHLPAAVESRPWRILASRDSTLAAARCAGAQAGISASACALPELLMALDRAIAARNQSRVGELDARLQEFLVWVEQFPVPVIVKTATGLRRIETGPLALPLPPEKVEKLEQFLAWFDSWLPATLKMTA